MTSEVEPSRFQMLVGKEPTPVSPIPRDAQRFQGHRAGIVTRFAADAIDFGVLMVALGVIYASCATVLFLLNPRAFALPAPPVWAVFLVGAAVLFVYLTLGWWATGRTYGKHVMGLRVLSFDGGRMRLVGAAARAAFCTVFPITIFWVVISRANRSVADVLLRSSVVYDWSVRRAGSAPTAP